MSQRVLVTGGTGFVGSHVVEAFLSRGWTVRAIVRDLGRLSWLSAMPVEIVRSSLTSREDLRAAVDDCNVVIHCAAVTKASNRAEYYKVNAHAVGVLTESARDAGVSRFVYCSSHAASGPAIDGEVSHEADEAHPISDYGRSKLEGERWLVGSAGQMKWVILRPPSVMGPRDAQFLPLFRVVAKYGLSPAFGPNGQRYSYIYVSDFVRALCAASEAKQGLNEIYFAANDETLDWQRASELIAGFANRRVRTLTVPKIALRTIGCINDFISALTGRAVLLSSQKIREMTAPGWICSSEKIRRAWGFQCEYSTEEALRETFEYYHRGGRL